LYGDVVVVKGAVCCYKTFALVAPGKGGPTGGTSS
jgi:hypothetical protein